MNHIIIMYKEQNKKNLYTLFKQQEHKLFILPNNVKIKKIKKLFYQEVGI